MTTRNLLGLKGQTAAGSQLYTSLGMRDWIREMHQHTGQIQEAIDSDQHDLAWRRIHEFQGWCIERARAENFDRKTTISFLSLPHRFFARILKKEGRHKEELIHLIHEAASDHRDFKYYPKEIRRCFKRCRLETTCVEAALSLYEEYKGTGDFTGIRDKVSTWS